MGNTSSKYDPMLSNLPPGYIPTYPATPPWLIKRRWNPFRSRRKRDEEMKQYYYTTPFVFTYPPGSQYPMPNNAVQPAIQMPDPMATAPLVNMPVSQMPIPQTGLAPPVIPELAPRRYRRRSVDSYGDSISDSEDDRDRRYRRRRRHASYTHGGYHHNPLPPPPKDVLNSSPYRHILATLPSRSRSDRRYDYGYDRYYDPRDERPRRHRRRNTTAYERDVERERELDREEREIEREEREREKEREARDRERRERERDERERERARREREEERRRREEDREEEREEELEERRRLRRRKHLSFTDNAAAAIAGIFGRGPNMPEPEPVIPRGPTPAPPGGFGGGGVSPMHFNVVPPGAPSSTAGPPPPPPMQLSTPALGIGGMQMPTPGGGMQMPALGVGGMVMPSPGGVVPPVIPGGISMPTPGGSAPVIPGQTVPMPSSYGASGMMPSPSRPSMGMPNPMPMPFAGAGPPPVIHNVGAPITISGYEHPELMAQSEHSVLYKGDLYPSALHLFEALKFLPHRTDIAREIREATDHEVMEIGARHGAAKRPDWERVALDMMDEALYHKFRQHSGPRAILFETGDAPLHFQDAADPFWGGGPDDLGENHMGRALERVRQRLRDEIRG